MHHHEKLKPLSDRVLVAIEEEKEQKTEGGLIIPDAAREKPTRGVVVALGTGRTDIEDFQFKVAVGDLVMFQRFAGQDVVVGERNCRLMREDDIIGIVESDPA